MNKKFRDFEIRRTCNTTYSNYSEYKPHLRRDFNSRCAYCNLNDGMITTPFEIDHFIPMSVFSSVYPNFETNYKNLMYSCKKCNLAKSNHFEGELKEETFENKLFYDPTLVDYNEIFYRNEVGSICSNDQKGINMIKIIKLYRRIHNLAWVCELTKETLDKLNQKIIKTSEDNDKQKFLLEAKSELQEYYINVKEIFIANYNNKNFE